ncbi:MAG: hypothetical protein U0326_32670 [Polyangiales bacterium]
MLLAAAPARAQPRRPQRAVTAAVVAERARAMLADGREADALAAIAAAPARQRTAPEVVAVRAIATFQTLGVRPEPSSLRSLAPSVRRDLEVCCACSPRGSLRTKGTDPPRWRSVARSS